MFRQIEAWQGARPWGRMLDAGTGEHSLRWILGLSTTAWTAVTGDPGRHEDLQRAWGPRMRPADRLVTGNWTDPELLAGERYDTVLADYLLGALDGFSPYFQDRIFHRLRPHVAGRLYVVGLAPIDDEGGGEAGDIVRAIARLRDACILLAGHRCYREYPLDWVHRHLVAAGFRVIHRRRVPIVYGPRWIDGQLDVCLRKLPCFPDPDLAEATRRRVEELRRTARDACDRLGGLRFGHDWLVAAEPG
ncbi:MAG: class I SAM-dependent methyltransferase [Deltaproteobacteria bacterium]|nr:MAG: class I SAM-dependent methyltransferase [Deltaproteobacteria bacterium]